MEPTASSPLVFLTGAGGGIGSATVVALGAGGARVIGVNRRDADLSVYKDILELTDRTAQEHGLLDWVVYAHGFIDAETDITKQREEDIAATFNINTLSVVYLTKLLLPRVRRGFVFISSTAGLSPSGLYAAYSASKAAVNAFVQALAKNRSDLIFIAVCPGPTNTPMRQKIDADAASTQTPEVIANVIADIIVGSSLYKSGDVIVVRDGRASLQGR